MIVNTGAIGKSREKSPPLYTISGGDYSYKQEVASDGTVNWEIALLSGSSKTITFQRVVDKVDVFLCAGGKPGGIYTTGETLSGGAGGAGGGTRTASSISVSSGTAYSFTVGGSNAATSIFGYSVSSGGGSAGGRGANYNSRYGADNGTSSTTKAFGGATLHYNGRLYGPGGGGGGVHYGNITYNGGSGGSTGGGHGGDETHKGSTDRNGSANTGAGGGGGAITLNNSYVGGGSGGSGIIIIRNHRP